MSNLSEFTELWSDMDSMLKGFLSEAKELRDSVPEPQVSDDPHTLHERLVASRAAQNRLEGILSDVGQVRSRLRKLVTQLNDEYEDKWRDTMSRTRTGEYMSGKAQDATYQLGAIEELRNLRRGKQMLADAEEVYDVVYLKHRGMDSARRDYETLLRTISIESRLES